MSTPTPASPEEVRVSFARTLEQHWKLFLIEGIVLVILGALAVVIPPLATIGFTVFLGWLLLVSGVVGLATTFWSKHAPGFWWSLLSAVLAIAVGGMLLASPVGGAVSLTLVMIVFFAIEGVATIMFALDHRSQLSGRWTWLLLSGVVDLVLAALIYAGLPGTAAWAIGLMVGINLLVGGATMIGMALHARQPHAA